MVFFRFQDVFDTQAYPAIDQTTYTDA